MINHLIFPVLRIFARRRIKKITGIENIPKSGPALLVSNHVDYLDGWLLTLLVVFRIKRKIYFVSQSKNYFWTGGMTIPLEKHGKQEALTKALESLKNNKIVVFFPEGQRNDQKELLKGKTGAARLALWSKCPVIPIGIMAPSASHFSKSLRWLFSKPHEVIISIGTPVALENYYNKPVDYQLLTDCTREIMKAVGRLANKSYHY